tara:strand:- start:6485 stop:7783 length:1299 start_codon:yes stop_codon:yes gene_type:complete
MATHDYVIANGSGAAVRSDLNNALAAIVSNNSNSSAPSTTYAYQWWADTSNNLLKIRNSANNAWITLRELDGTMLLEDGTASAPGLAFTDDVDTGLFSPAANQLGITTAGVERVEFGASEVVFNDSGASYDFRIEGDADGNLFTVDASADAIGVGIAAPVKSKLHLRGAGQTGAISDSGNADDIFRLSSDGTATGSGGGVAFANSQGDTAGSIGFAAIRGSLADGSNNTIGNISFQTRNASTDTALTEAFRITANGALYTNLFPAVDAATERGIILAKGYAGLQGTGGSTHGFRFNYYWTGSVLEAWVSNSKVGNVTLTSDYRTKREIATQTASGINKVKLLRPVTFKRAAFGELFQEEDVVREGFIAHEVGEVIPSGCEGAKDAENEVQSLNIDAIVSVLTKALQEAIAKVETLETQNADLLARVTALEGG